MDAEIRPKPREVPSDALAGMPVEVQASMSPSPPRRTSACSGRAGKNADLRTTKPPLVVNTPDDTTPAPRFYEDMP